MSAPLAPIAKPPVGSSNWHPPMWAVIDRCNELLEIIRDEMGTALLEGSGITITPNDAGNSIIISSTGGGGSGNDATILTQAQYDALGTPDPDTLYYISDAPQRVPNFAPSDYGMKGWTLDPATAANSSGAMTAGVVYLMKVKVTDPGPIANLMVQVATAGAALSNCYAAVFSMAGARLAVSADLSTSLQSSGAKTLSLGAGFTATDTDYYVAILIGAGTTIPLFARAADTQVVNIGLTAGNFRYCSSGTAQTAMPSSITLSGTAAVTTAWFAGLKT